jgi:hypothetical protein
MIGLTAYVVSVVGAFLLGFVIVGVLASWTREDCYQDGFHEGYGAGYARCLKDNGWKKLSERMPERFGGRK